MFYLIQLYTELKLSKKEIYKEYSCLENVMSFIKHIGNKKLPKAIFDHLHIVFFYNNNNGYSLYGKESFSFHVNLLFFDKESSNWYVIDYDIENIIIDYPLDKPILCSEFLQSAFSTKSAKSQISIAVEEGNYYPLQSFQQVMIFTLQEFNHCYQENANLIHKLRFISLQPKKQEENFLWELYKSFDISFNNLYELVSFLKKSESSINLLRTCYKDKSFEEISADGFANAECRLGKEKLLTLQDFLFDLSKSINLESKESKNEAGGSTLFALKKQIPELTDKDITIGSGINNLRLSKQ